MNFHNKYTAPLPVCNDDVTFYAYCEACRTPGGSEHMFFHRDLWRCYLCLEEDQEDPDDVHHFRNRLDREIARRRREPSPQLPLF